MRVFPAFSASDDINLDIEICGHGGATRLATKMAAALKTTLHVRLKGVK
jgi:hypothetical protein